MHETDRWPWILQAMRRRDAAVGPRLVLSLASALVLTGLGLIGARLFCSLVASGPGGWSWSNGRVRDDDVAVAMAVASVLWLAVQFWIWRRMEQARWLVRSILYTVGVVIVTLAVCIMVAQFIRRDEEFIIVGLVLLAGAIILLIWASALLGLARGRPVLTADDLVDVRCPSCQYSLIGLTELRCPECGQAFTIDQLIREQHYDIRGTGGVPGRKTPGDGLSSSGRNESAATPVTAAS